MLERITPVLLTYNEACNIERTLSCLKWARDIVVVDSGSTDETLSIVSRFPAVRIFHRPFDTFAAQLRFATEQTDIATDWILRLDADFQLTEALIEEVRKLDPDSPVAAYRIPFAYAIFGRRLCSSLYPARPILLRRGKFSIDDRGHADSWTIDGPVRATRNCAVHDDRKSIESWLRAQGRYMVREVDRATKGRGGWKDWIRSKPPVMPIAVFVYCLIAKGLIFNGRAGLLYALQRAVAEAILSLMLLEERLRQAPVRLEQSDFEVR
jgi:glycosyltransferase involved in cell wall biosynthesis